MTGISTSTQLNNQVDHIKAQHSQLDLLLYQLNTQKQTKSLSGMADDIIPSLNARTSFSQNSSYLNSLEHENIKMDLILQTTDEIRTQTEHFSKQATLFNRENALQTGDLVLFDDPLTPEEEELKVGLTSAETETHFETLLKGASQTLGIVKDLLNAQDMQGYLLNGTDHTNKPLHDTSALDTVLTQMIDDWKTGTLSTDDLIRNLTDRDPAANPNAITDNITGFSEGLSNDQAGTTHLRASDNITLQYEAHANTDGFRNLIVGLTFLSQEALTPAIDTYTPPNAPPAAPDIHGAPGRTVDEMKENFFEVFDAITAMVETALHDIDETNTSIQTTQARAQSIIQDHQDMNELLSNTVADIENIDINEIAVQVSSLQNHLQASYAVTGMIQGLSLVNYL